MTRKIAFFTRLSEYVLSTERYYSISFRLIQWDL